MTILQKKHWCFDSKTQIFFAKNTNVFEVKHPYFSEGNRILLKKQKSSQEKLFSIVSFQCIMQLFT